MKKIFFSMYAKVLCIFFAIIFTAILVPAIIVNSTQLKKAQDYINSAFEHRANQIEKLVKEENIELKKAVEYFSDFNTSEQIYNSLEDMGIEFTQEEKLKLENGEKIPYKYGNSKFNIGVITKIDGKYITVLPEIYSGISNMFADFQKYMIFIPIIIGVALVMLATFIILKPIKLISKGANKVAMGDFSVQIKHKGRDELSQMVHNFNKMVNALNANEYLHKEFVSNVSHEFKTPLATISGYAKLLDMEEVSKEERMEYAQIIISESKRLSGLATNIMRLAELENNVIGKTKTTFSLSEQIRSAAVLLQMQWEQKNIEVVCELENAEYTGDKDLLFQVWLNLIANAIKYTDAGGKINISLVKGEKIIVKIQDNGVGMTKEEQQQIFTRFYKADKSRNKEGSGLGLSIAKKIAELHNGSITLLSEKGKGSVFIVTLG